MMNRVSKLVNVFKQIYKLTIIKHFDLISVVNIEKKSLFSYHNPFQA